MTAQFVARHRWSRKRKLLPSLNLKYPSDDEMGELSRLARVDDVTGFGQHIRSILLDAHLNDRSLRNRSAPQVRKRLDKLAKQAHQLAIMLKAIDVGAKSSAEHAGRLLEIQFASARLERGIVFIPEYVRVVETLGRAADKAAKKNGQVKTRY